MLSKRFIEIDLLRGLAVVGMIVFHTFFILDYFGVVSNEMYDGWWLVLARSVQFIFLGLVGVSLALSKQKEFLTIGPHAELLKNVSAGRFYYRQLKRAFLVFFMAMLVTLFTYLAVQKAYVAFGVLHLISLSIFLVMFLAGRKWLSLFLGVLALLIALLIRDIEVTNPMLYPFGFEYIGINTLDYFPVFPWMAVPLFGVFFGNILYSGFRRRFFMKGLSVLEKDFFGKKPIVFFGKHGIAIYMLHIPAILVLLYVLGLIDW